MTSPAFPSFGELHKLILRSLIEIARFSGVGVSLDRIQERTRLPEPLVHSRITDLEQLGLVEWIESGGIGFTARGEVAVREGVEVGDLKPKNEARKIIVKNILSPRAKILIAPNFSGTVQIADHIGSESESDLAPTLKDIQTTLIALKEQRMAPEPLVLHASLTDLIAELQVEKVQPEKVRVLWSTIRDLTVGTAGSVVAANLPDLAVQLAALVNRLAPLVQGYL